MLQETLPVPVDWVRDFCDHWRIQELSLFGSVLTPGFSPDSDIDVLVRFEAEANWSAFDLLDIQEDLKNEVGREIDLVEMDALRNPIRRKEILGSRKILHASE